MAGYSPQRPRGDRPLAIIGISDVIVLESRPTVPVRSHQICAWGRWIRNVAIPEVAATRVHEIDKCFDIVWASEWGHNAHSAFREALDLPDKPWPFLPVQFDKLPRIRQYADGLPWIWIDGPYVDLGQVPEATCDGIIVRLDPSRGIADVDPVLLADKVRQQLSWRPPV